MAYVLNIANGNRSTVIDLLNGTLKLTRTWTETDAAKIIEYESSEYGAKATFDHFELVQEIFELTGRDTITNLRTAIKALSTALEKTRLYHKDPWHNTTWAAGGPESWWIEWSTDGESTKRSLMYSGSIAITHGGIGLTPMMEGGEVILTLQITRHPVWETLTNSGESKTWAVRLVTATDPLLSIEGDLPARVWETYTATGVAPQELYQAWVGIRPKGMGDTYFHPTWECENGTAYNGATLSVSDADASPASAGKSTQKASPAATLTKYLSITVGQVHLAYGNTQWSHSIGTYLVLLRCKVNGGTVSLQMRQGYIDSGVATSSTVPGDEVFISNTDYMLIEMGELRIPPAPFDGQSGATTATYVSACGLEIYAAQISGTSTLYLDAIAMIPTAHFFSVKGMAGTGPCGSWAFGRPDGTQITTGWRTSAGIFSLGVEANYHNWGIPPGDSILVMAGQGETSHDMSQGIDYAVEYYPRFSIFR